MTKLPIKLNISPLLVARVEIRFKTDAPLIEGLVLGFLSEKNKKNSQLKVERFSINDIPKQIRDNDPNLQYAPLKRIYTTDDFYSIFLGDRLLSVSCEKYQGWENFKEYLIGLVSFLKSSMPHFIDQIGLVQATYVDFIEKELYENLSDVLDWTIQFKQNDLSNNEDIFIKTSTKKHIEKDIYRGSIQIVSNAILEGSKKQGVAIETSTEYNITNNMFLDQYVEILDNLHQTNKENFFMCLTDSFLEKLGPMYE